MVASPSRRRRVLALAAPVVALLGVVAALLPAAPAAALWPTSTVRIEGHGWGHGRGLGQYGALGYAVDHGWNHVMILDHYYGNTTAGSQGDGPITVRLAEQDDKHLFVTSGGTFQIGSNSFPAGTWAMVQRLPEGWAIFGGPSSAGPWTALESGIDINLEPIAFVHVDPGDDINGMISVQGANRRHYRGTVKITAFGAGTRVVNTVTMEQYLRGVVPRESPASWADLGGGKGLEALKAQAVAARSYAWAESRDAKFKTCDTISCQVYGGAGLNGVRIEDARTDRAVGETAGGVRIRNGAIQRTEFSSSTGGHTAGGTFPAVPDLGDSVAANPNHNWTVEIPISLIQTRWPTIGQLENVAVIQRNGIGDFGGRAQSVRIRGTSGTVTVTGETFRSNLNLKSDWFRIVALTGPAVTMTQMRTGNGGWFAAADGSVGSFGQADYFGAINVPLARPVVGVASRPQGGGYWLVATDGGVFTFGNVGFHGSTGGIRLNQPVVGMAPTASGNGYWLVASDGGIFSFGDAQFFGSTGDVRLNRPIVGMAPTPSGNGYYLVASDGGIFTYGDAQFHGSTGGIRLNRPVIGMGVRPTNGGYWLVADDGGIFTFGDAPFHGSAAGSTLPIVGVAPTPSGNGYWLGTSEGGVFTFGDAGL